MAEATSSQTVDRVRRGYEFWNSGTPDLMLALYAEDAELDLSAVFTDIGVYRGRDAAYESVEQWMAASDAKGFVRHSFFLQLQMLPPSSLLLKRIFAFNPVLGFNVIPGRVAEQFLLIP